VTVTLIADELSTRCLSLWSELQIPVFVGAESGSQGADWLISRATCTTVRVQPGILLRVDERGGVWRGSRIAVKSGGKLPEAGD